MRDKLGHERSGHGPDRQATTATLPESTIRRPADRLAGGAAIRPRPGSTATACRTASTPPDTPNTPGPISRPGKSRSAVSTSDPPGDGPGRAEQPQRVEHSPRPDTTARPEHGDLGRRLQQPDRTSSPSASTQPQRSEPAEYPRSCSAERAAGAVEYAQVARAIRAPRAQRASTADRSNAGPECFYPAAAERARVRPPSRCPAERATGAVEYAQFARAVRAAHAQRFSTAAESNAEPKPVAATTQPVAATTQPVAATTDPVERPRPLGRAWSPQLNAAIRVSASQFAPPIGVARERAAASQPYAVTVAQSVADAGECPAVAAGFLGRMGDRRVRGRKRLRADPAGMGADTADADSACPTCPPAGQPLRLRSAVHQPRGEIRSMQLRDKTALVTGGGSGIGLGMAGALAAEGCRVAIAGREPIAARRGPGRRDAAEPLARPSVRRLRPGRGHRAFRLARRRTGTARHPGQQRGHQRAEADRCRSWPPTTGTACWGSM